MPDTPAGFSAAKQFMGLLALASVSPARRVASEFSKLDPNWLAEADAP